MASNVPSMEKLQAALAEAEEDMPEQPKRKSKIISWPQVPQAGERLVQIKNLAIDCAIVLIIIVLTLVGDRYYLYYNDTGSSKFEAFLKSKGYGEDAIAYKQMQEVCLDSNNKLPLCKGAAWLYRHPEIAVWPDKTTTAEASRTLTASLTH